MTRVIVTEAAVEDLDLLTRTHSLPPDTRERLRRSLSSLSRFPEIGPQLGGRWGRFRFVLGPWRWMLVVYSYDEEADLVAVVTIQDARSGASARS